MLVAAKSLYGRLRLALRLLRPGAALLDRQAHRLDSGCATQITAGASADEVVGAWRDELAAFDARRQQYLLYPDRPPDAHTG